jgi:PAS domain S-box-containing protein
VLHDAATQEWEITLQPHSGPALPVAIRVGPALDRNGSVTGLRWLLRDESARHLADMALWKERNFISAILDTTAALMLVLDGDGRIVRFNRACELVTGYTQEEILGQLIWDRLLLPDQVDAVKAVFSELATGHFPNEHENHWVTRSGEQRLIHWSNTVLKNRSGKFEYIIGTGVDITAQRAAEDLARRQQAALAHGMRVSTIGEMASGLAHEINQPLAAIASYAEGCVRRLESGGIDAPSLRPALQQIALQAERAATIIQHLRHFVSKGASQRNATNINTLIAQALKFAQAGLDRNGVMIKLDLNPLPEAVVDDIQIQQVVLNLVRNALDAIGPSTEQGQIDIHSGLNADQEIQISICDNGHGLPEPVQEKVFEPFFTTKDNGMGLGLAISRTIVESHGGRLWMTRNPGPGTTFHFTLPLKNPDDDA